VLLRHVLWTAVDHAKPIQFHVGYGDSDINLHRCDPTQMTEFIRRTVGTGAQVMLLHCWPFIREAGFLAQVYPHVWLDTGAATNYTGPSSQTLIRHALEMAPFGKVLFSSDAFGLPELYYCGTVLWRRGLAGILQEWVDRDEVSTRDALRYIEMTGRTNAQRAYALADA
jgi:predicted TIM-barrel fold metal-dependent hydrolase